MIWLSECNEQRDAPYGPWSISEDAYANYKKLFSNGAKDGFTDREIAMSLFQKSKQSQATIDEVY